jgi:hypothetical protein
MYTSRRYSLSRQLGHGVEYLAPRSLINYITLTMMKHIRTGGSTTLNAIISADEFRDFIIRPISDQYINYFAHYQWGASEVDLVIGSPTKE